MRTAQTHIYSILYIKYIQKWALKQQYIWNMRFEFTFCALTVYWHSFVRFVLCYQTLNKTIMQTIHELCSTNNIELTLQNNLMHKTFISESNYVQQVIRLCKRIYCIIRLLCDNVIINLYLCMRCQFAHWDAQSCAARIANKFANFQMQTSFANHDMAKQIKTL